MSRYNTRSGASNPISGAYKIITFTNNQIKDIHIIFEKDIMEYKH